MPAIAEFFSNARAAVGDEGMVLCAGWSDFELGMS
jgi:hypothetical protein